MLQGTVRRGKKTLISALAFNDVVVSKGIEGNMVECEVRIDDEFIYHQRSDGLIIATPTGATAYSLSAGGPLLHPSIPGWVLVPIAPHTLSNRPIVLSDQAEVAIEIVAGRDASANFDMQSLASLLHGDRITRSAAFPGAIEPRSSSTPIAQAEAVAFLQTLRKHAPDAAGLLPSLGFGLIAVGDDDAAQTVIAALPEQRMDRRVGLFRGHQFFFLQSSCDKRIDLIAWPPLQLDRKSVV